MRCRDVRGVYCGDVRDMYCLDMGDMHCFHLVAYYDDANWLHAVVSWEYVHCLHMVPDCDMLCLYI
jgi:hypothetical protein